MNNRQTELFWELLAKPADRNYTHIDNLRQLASEYPQSNLLQSLLVYVGEDDNLGRAAVFTDPRLLYKLRNNSTSLSPVSDEQVIKQVIAGKRYFHSEEAVSEAESVSLPEPEAHPSLSEEDLQQQALIDEYHPEEHFFKPEETLVEDKQETITEPENLDELINYGDEVTTGEHELAPAEQVEETIAEPEKLDDLINYGDEVTTGEHELNPPVNEFHQPEHQEAAPVEAAEQEQPVAEESTAAAAEPAIEQHIPQQEAIQPEQQAEQEIELPTPGFYVPSQDEENTDSYDGGDMASKLYASYASSFEHTPQSQFEQAQPAEPIEDEVFNEIVGIDDIEMPVPEPFTVPQDEVPQSPQPVQELEGPTLGFSVPSTPVEEKAAPQEDTATAKSRKVDLTDETEKLMLSNIAATDFFVFDQALSDRIRSGDEPKEEQSAFTAAPQPEPAATASAPEPAVQQAEPEPAKNNAGPKKIEYERVTKYFDEKMPYSFMWWLDKTRKEHSGIYQPFVLDTTQSIEKNVPDELQQQYYENIFQLTSVDELERATGSEPVVFDSKKKEDDIIERFIHESPQIKPQTSEKLDNENKAKRSSEDQDEIVTETLAQIYADQMLYHKAIKVYQNLMLKFPEKRRYFAGQIEQLEKKIS